MICLVSVSLFSGSIYQADQCVISRLFVCFLKRVFFFLLIFLHDSPEITINGSTTQGVASCRARDFILDFIFFLARMLYSSQFFHLVCLIELQKGIGLDLLSLSCKLTSSMVPEAVGLLLILPSSSQHPKMFLLLFHLYIVYKLLLILIFSFPLFLQISVICSLLLFDLLLRAFLPSFMHVH